MKKTYITPTVDEIRVSSILLLGASLDLTTEGAEEGDASEAASRSSIWDNWD